jgi:hypothetical protein
MLLPERDEYEFGAAIRAVLRPRYVEKDLTFVFLKVSVVPSGYTSLSEDDPRREVRWYTTAQLGRDTAIARHYSWDVLMTRIAGDYEVVSWEQLVSKLPHASTGIGPNTEIDGVNVMQAVSFFKSYAPKGASGDTPHIF